MSVLKLIRLIILTCITMSFSLFAGAQNNNGGWKDYLSFSDVTKIAVSPGKVYCATGGGLMYYDLQDNSISKFSLNSGLSDFGIKTIAWSDEYKVLIVAYDNCNIDLIYNNRIVNIPDIRRKQIAGKNINKISVNGSEAYLSCSFGIVVLNLEKQEIKDTYIIGSGGTYMNVNDTEAHNGFLYAATDNGVFRAELNGANLLDYESWSQIQNIPRSNEKFNHLITHAGRIIANYTPEEWYSDEMYVLNGDTWELYLRQIKFAFDMQKTGNYLLIASRDALFLVDENDEAEIINRYNFSNQQSGSINPHSAAIAGNGTIWVADPAYSLVKISGNNTETVTLPGPIDNKIFSVNQTGSALWVLPGNRTGWERARFQKYEDNRWIHFKTENNPEFEGQYNLTSVTVNPANPAHFYVSSWGSGLYEYRDDKFVERYSNSNSPLETALPSRPDEPYVRVGGTAFDSEGNLWITNSTVAKNLLKLSASGKWETFALPEIATNYNVGEIIVTQHDDKWIVLPKGHDVYVVNKNATKKRWLQVTAYFNNGVYEEFKRMNDVYSIAEDRKGAVWVGTSAGVAVFNSPQRIWDSETFYATRPSLDLKDGLFHPLLETETVTAIAVDGANRKWLGTSNSGAYLVSEDGNNEVINFNTDNSPLLSNNITGITINDKTGEVFFGTDAGLVSYQGDAIIGNETFAGVYVYPNPVRETWNGPVTITGLVEDTDIKITDISGNLVYHGTSLGGQAEWNGKNLNGNRVKTGVYMVFCTGKNGEETHVEKLLFIH